MARYVSPEMQAALEAGILVTRDFMRIKARRRDNGQEIIEQYWSDTGDITAPVIDPASGLEVSYTFRGAGGMIGVDPIPMVSNLTVQTVEIVFSQLDDRINELMRTYTVRQAPVEIFEGAFDPETGALIEAAEPIFVGFVDGAPVETPAEGEVGQIKISCVSNTQELTRSNPDLRSHESQLERQPGDAFYKDVATAGDLQIFWGRASERLTAPGGS